MNDITTIIGDNDESLKIDDNVLIYFKNKSLEQFNNNLKSIKEINQEHYEIFNKFLPSENKTSPCITKEKNLIECLSSNKGQFLNCSNILKEFANCQEKFVREYNNNN